MKEHLENLVLELAHAIDFSKEQTVIDIGSNDGTLLKFYPNWFKRIGYDLVPKFRKDYNCTGISFINAPFNRNVIGLISKAKIITAISMFYDLDDPIPFVTSLSECLDSKGIIVIQQNYLLSMLQNNAFDNIVHEHLSYHSLLSMEKIFKPFNLDIFDIKVNDLNGGSFRTYICHKGDYKVSSRVDTVKRIELDYELDHEGAYIDFSNRVGKIRQDLYSLLSDIHRREELVYIYGASTRGNTLLQYAGIDNSLCQKAVERNPEKYGKKIASVGIPIISEAEARQEHPLYMLVLPWFFRKEVVKRESEYLKSGGKLIFPLPQVEIISK
ncbi:MAG: class I SAM-dependent methyltransferase [Sulfuricurvum sp.]|nr:class I SAM-dependent methyltransferase [Sulfuricurvum sp.]